MICQLVVCFVDFLLQDGVVFVVEVLQGFDFYSDFLLFVLQASDLVLIKDLLFVEALVKDLVVLFD